MSWAPNPRVGGSILGLDLAVVMLSKSLYPHCSSITNYKIRDLASAKEGKISVQFTVPKTWLDFEYQHHTSGTINMFLQVSSPAPVECQSAGF